MTDTELKKYLDGLYNKYRRKPAGTTRRLDPSSGYSSKDPVWTLHRLDDPREIELLGFIISCYSYGQVDLINAFIERFLAAVDGSIYEFTLNFSKHKDKKRLRGLYYRFNDEEHLALLLLLLKKALLGHGSLNKMFLAGYRKDDPDITCTLARFTAQLKSPLKDKALFKHFIPDVGGNGLTQRGGTSPCKRLNLYLRWMVRKDEIDLGVWKGISKSQLIMPLDVHVHRVARALRLVERKSPDLKFALLLTERLKQFDPDDPVKYDFALCHIGIDKKLKVKS